MKSEFIKKTESIQAELLRFAYRFTANKEEANDLLQETSLKILCNENKYKSETNFRAWAYTIMRNIFINEYRKMMRCRTDALNFDVYDSSNNTEKICDLKDISHAVNTLPKEYKTPFALYISGFRYHEIAEKLELPLGTIKSRIFYARRELQQNLKDFYYR
jgi:RNA polymerase sigma-70 factor (ECF subfamily)